MSGISIIICSRNGSLRKELKSNINNTVGSQFELIVIDNSQNSKSIFEAYNLGLKSALFPYVLFLHDDVEFHTLNWGQILISFFSNYPEAGLLGVAGSKIKTQMPSGWWETSEENLYVNIRQHYRKERISNDVLGFHNDSFEEVAVVDGVFMALRKDDRISFNENLEGFHHYDTSLSVDLKNLGYKVFVTNQILIEHFSTGMIDSTWVKSTHRFHKEYSNCLPIGAGLDVRQEDEEYSLLSFIYTCLSTEQKLLALQWFLIYLRIKPLSKHNKRILRLFFSSKKPWVKI